MGTTRTSNKYHIESSGQVQTGQRNVTADTPPCYMPCPFSVCNCSDLGHAHTHTLTHADDVKPAHRCEFRATFLFMAGISSLHIARRASSATLWGRISGQAPSTSIERACAAHVIIRACGTFTRPHAPHSRRFNSSLLLVRPLAQIMRFRCRVFRCVCVSACVYDAFVACCLLLCAADVRVA